MKPRKTSTMYGIASQNQIRHQMTSKRLEKGCFLKDLPLGDLQLGPAKAQETVFIFAIKITNCSLLSSSKFPLRGPLPSGHPPVPLQQAAAGGTVRSTPAWYPEGRALHLTPATGGRGQATHVPSVAWSPLLFLGVVGLLQLQGTLLLCHVPTAQPRGLFCSPPASAGGLGRGISATVGVQGPAPQYLVLLPALPLLLDLLLLLQFLGHAGLPKGLALAPLVGFGVEGCLQGGIPSHAGHHLLSQLSRGRGGRVVGEPVPRGKA